MTPFIRSNFTNENPLFNYAVQGRSTKKRFNATDKEKKPLSH